MLGTYMHNAYSMNLQEKLLANTRIQQQQNFCTVSLSKCHTSRNQHMVPETKYNENANNQDVRIENPTSDRFEIV